MQLGGPELQHERTLRIQRDQQNRYEDLPKIHGDNTTLVTSL